MTEPNDQTAGEIDRPLRIATWLVAVGMILVLVFLIAGFQSWSVGLGIFLGGPLLLIGMILYVVSVIRDLYRQNVLGNRAEAD